MAILGNLYNLYKDSFYMVLPKHSVIGNVYCGDYYYYYYLLSISHQILDKIFQNINTLK